MTNPIVSVIVPCFNAAETIEATLQNCFAQSYESLEVIVIDNNCTDSTMDLVARAAKNAPCQVIITQCVQQGGSAARNAGLAIATGEYMQLLDADDQLEQDKILHQVEALEKRSDYQVVYGDWTWRFTASNGTKNEFRFISRPLNDFLLHVLIDDWRPPNVYLFKHRSPKNTTPPLQFDVGVRVAEDRAFLTRTALAGLKFLYVPNAGSRYNTWSPKQMTRSGGPVVRARDLRLIFSRLKEFATTAPGVQLSAAQQRLLHQSFARWSLNADSKHPQEQALNKLERDVLARLAMFPQPLFMEHLVRLLARGLLLDNRLSLLDDLGVATPSILDQRIELPSSALARFRTHGPLYTPQLNEARFSLYGVLEQMCERGLLQAAAD